MQHPGQMNVVNEHGTTPQQRRIFNPFYAFANHVSPLFFDTVPRRYYLPIPKREFKDRDPS
tara:strand:- start:359 stop:541 length:183 start_codon:yes stop_codon:yes gene_type:complete